MRSSRPRRRPGAVLVEIIIAVLVTSIAVSAIMSALLSAAMQSGRSTESEQASLYLNELLEDLRNYVTADTSPGADAPGLPTTGPQARPGEKSWRLPGDACECWALNPGGHDVTEYLDPGFRAKYGARMSYTVSVKRINGQDTRQVDARITWSPPP